MLIYSYSIINRPPSIHVHHAKQERPEQHVRAQSRQESVRQQTLSANEILLPIRAGLEQQQQPQTEHGHQVEQKAQNPRQSHDAWGFGGGNTRTLLLKLIGFS